jgi:hypothetical protein
LAKSAVIGQALVNTFGASYLKNNELTLLIITGSYALHAESIQIHRFHHECG